VSVRHPRVGPVDLTVIMSRNWCRVVMGVAVALSAASTADASVATATGKTRASSNFAAGVWHLRVQRLDARRVRVQIRFVVRVKRRTMIHFTYKTCSGSRGSPSCANERANRVSRRFLARPGSRRFRYSNIASYPDRGVPVSCAIAALDDLHPGRDGLRILGPTPQSTGMLCPR
jgi:hypothetical protein